MILENKYKINQEVWWMVGDKLFNGIILCIEPDDEPNRIQYAIKKDKDSDGIYAIKLEHELYSDRESAEAELNKIKVGDTVYYLDVDPKWSEILIKRSKFDGYLNDGKTYLLSNGDIVKEVFKSEEELIASLRSY